MSNIRKPAKILLKPCARLRIRHIRNCSVEGYNSQYNTVLLTVITAAANIRSTAHPAFLPLTLRGLLSLFNPPDNA